MGFLDKVLNVVSGASPLIGSAIGGVTSLLGSSKAADAQERANEQNYKMFQEQLNFNREMFDKTNEYNTPANQRKRYEEAGLNPYVMMGSDAGQATSQTAPSANPMQSADAYGRGIQQFGEALGQSVSSLPLHVQQVVSGREANKAAIIENAYRASNLQADLTKRLIDIDKQLADKNVSDETARLLRLQQDEVSEQLVQIREYNKYVSRRAQSDTEKAENEADIAYYEAAYKRELTRYQKTVADMFPEYQRAQTDAFFAQAYQALSSAALFDAQKDTEDLLRDERLRGVINENIEKAARANGIRIDNEQKKALMPLVVQQAQNEADAVKIGPIEVKGNSFRRYLRKVIDGKPASKSNYRLDTHMGKPLGK